MSLKDFQFLGKLGEGAYSSVYKARRLIDNEYYAIKKVKLNNLNDREKENALNQVRILASINHQNVVSYKESFIEQSTNFLYIIMEFADFGDLYQKITFHNKNGTRFSEEQIWSIVIQITRGLKALHELKILHRDIKSANVFLFKNGAVKLGDMNVSKTARSMCKTQTGTPYYASPEVWKDQAYDKKSDIWSLGCVIYEAITLKPPFRANDMEGLFKKVTRGFYPHIPPEYSQELSIVLKTMLQVTPHLRSTCDRILELPIVMKHLGCLPQEIQVEEKINNQLLQTIKLKTDAKEQLSIAMPKPRYMATLDYTDRGRRHIEEEEDMKDWHNFEIKRQLEEELMERQRKEGKEGKERKEKEGRNKLPRIYDSGRRQKIHSEVHSSSRPYEKQTIVHRLMEPIRVEEELRMRGKRPRRERYELQSQKRMPQALQGKLRSLSPDVIIRILQKEREKKKVYSIIGTN